MKTSQHRFHFGYNGLPRRQTLLGQGAILASLILAPYLLPVQALAQSYTVTGDNIATQSVSATSAYVTAGPGSSTLTLDGYTTGQVILNPEAATSGTYYQTINLTGTMTVNTPNYSSVISSGTNANHHVTINAGSDVTIIAGTGGFGAIWARNDTSGDVAINSGALISATDQDGINAVTNLGTATIVNSGTVIATGYGVHGLYADANGAPSGGPLVSTTVSITNSGYVTATFEAARSINYYGLATINNSGYAYSAERYALVAWSADGAASIVNSGTAISGQRPTLVAASSNGGSADVTNSGVIIANNTGDSSGKGYQGIQVYTDPSTIVTINNTATGLISANYDAGILAMLPSGTATITNAGLITALYGIEAYSGDGSLATTSETVALTSATTPTISGSVAIINSGTITTQNVAVYSDATQTTVTNTGVISTTGSLAIQTVSGNSTIFNSGIISTSGTNATAIAMGSGTNRLVLTETSQIVGQVTTAGTNSTLELTGTNTGIFYLHTVGNSAQYQGFSTLEKTGSGTWIVSGSNAFAGDTVIKNGMLSIGSGGASVVGSVTNNARLDLGTNLFTVGGSLSGTGSIGLTIGSTDHGYLVNSNAASDLRQMGFTINPGSQTALNQTLVLVKDYAGQVPVGATAVSVSDYRLYRVVQALASGTDSQGSAYGNGSLLLTDVPLSQTPGYTPVPTNNAALVIQNYTGSNPALGNLSLAVQSLTTPSDINKAGAQLRPEANGATQTAAMGSVSQLLQTITLRNDSLRNGLAPVGAGPDKYPQGLDLWGQSFYNNSAQGVRDGVDGFTSNTAGFAFGADTQATDALRTGLSFAYAATNVNDRATRAGSGEDVDSYLGSLYGSYDGSPWYVDGALIAGLHQFDSTRLVDIGGIRETAKGRFSAHQLGVKLEGGYPLAFNPVTVTPLASLAYNHLRFNDYTEHGAPGANLQVGSDSIDSLRSGLGAKISTTVNTPGGWLFQPDLHAFWFHEFGNTALNQTSQFVAAGGSSFLVPGIKLASDGLGLGTALSLVAPKGVNLSLKYDAELQQDYVSHSVVFEARFKF